MFFSNFSKAQVNARSRNGGYIRESYAFSFERIIFGRTFR